MDQLHWISMIIYMGTLKIISLHKKYIIEDYARYHFKSD